VTRRKPCVQEVLKGIEVKPTLVEAQSPEVKRHARRSMPDMGFILPLFPGDVRDANGR